MLSSFFLLFIIAETIKVFLNVNPEWTRKIVHIGAGFISFFIPYFFKPLLIVLLGFLFLLFFILTFYLKKLKSVHGIKRKTWGAFLYPVSLAFIYPFTYNPPYLFQIPVLVLALSDAFAGISGILLGKKEFLIYGYKRTLEGSFSFLLTTFLILFGFKLAVNIPLSYLHIILLSFILTFVEFFSIYGFDNFTIPVFTALILWALK